MRNCPLCGQPLPKTLTPEALQARTQRLAAPILASERHRLQQELAGEFEEKLKARTAFLRTQALQDARMEVKKDLAASRSEVVAVRRRLREAARLHLAETRQAVTQARKEAESQLRAEIARVREDARRRETEARQELWAQRDEATAAQRELRKAKHLHEAEVRQVRQRLASTVETRVALERERLERQAKRRQAEEARLADSRHELIVERLKTQLDRERSRHQADGLRLQRQVEELSHKLDRQSGEQRGEEAELDLFTQLQAEFPGDRVERVKKGVKGADIIQHVMSGTRELGRIVYESKNVATWQNAFVGKAKRYQSQYNTPYVLVVTRSMPRKQKGLCVVRDIPVVEPRMALPLARILSDAIVEIGRLRLSSDASGEKARGLFQYILSDEFQTRFRTISDSVADLRQQQSKEKKWHEDAWETRDNLHEQIDSCHREILRKVRVATGAETAKPRVRLVRATA